MTPEGMSSYGPRLRHGCYVGGKESPEHYIWRSMLARCENPKDGSYSYYGAVGIKVCRRWHTFDNFLADMGPRPFPDYSLDRESVHGGYRPSNCRWATRSTQQQNKSNTRRWQRGDKIDTLTGWARHLGISKELAHWRIKTHGSFIKGEKWQLLPKIVLS